MKRHITVLMLLTIVLSICFPQAASERDGEDSLTLYCYDTFSSEWGSGPTLIPLFEERTGIKVNVVSRGDAVEMLSAAIMEGDKCPADIVMGISSESAASAYDAGIFSSYSSPALDDIDDGLKFDKENRLLPFDYGTFAFVFDTESKIKAPTSLEDLRDPMYKGKIILINPTTSSVGLGLLLWTIEVYGEDGYLDWWRDVKENALTIADGWSGAYGLFTEGEAPIVLSYTTSPVYHVLWEDSTRYQALIFDEGHHNTIESIGILKASKHRENAEKFIDFILTDGQEETAVKNSMYPVNNKTELPEAYEYAPKSEKVLSLEPERIAKNLEKWIDAWNEAMSK